MKYNVTIKEVLARTVQVEAGSVEEAESAVRKMYHNCDIVLLLSAKTPKSIKTLPEVL